MKASTSEPSAEEERVLKYKGVRRRKWGKWVSEIRLPNSRERIWLGSYDSPRKAARAFDAAAVCLRGRHAAAAGGRLNFPSLLPNIPSPRPLTPDLIQAAAARHAALQPPSPVSAPPLLQQSELTPESQPESSEVSADSLGDMDWSFMDQLLADFDPMVDKFEHDYFLGAALPLPPPHLEEDVGNVGGGSNSSLWNF